MFLGGMNSMILGGMGFDGLGMTILNTCAFAPVPVMLYLFGKLKAKKGMRFAYQTCLLAFAVAILGFVFGSLYVCGPDNKDEAFKEKVAPANAFIGNYLRLIILLRMKKFSKAVSDVRGYFTKMAEITGTLWEHDNIERGT